MIVTKTLMFHSMLLAWYLQTMLRWQSSKTNFPTHFHAKLEIILELSPKKMPFFSGFCGFSAFHMICSFAIFRCKDSTLLINLIACQWRIGMNECWLKNRFKAYSSFLLNVLSWVDSFTVIHKKHKSHSFGLIIFQMKLCTWLNDLVICAGHL